jgi:hypothetical protein
MSDNVSAYGKLVRQAIAAGCEIGACPNSDCAGDVWVIEQQSGCAYDWRVTELGSTDAWVVYGSAPACPWCGQRLLLLPYRETLKQANQP